MGSASAPDCKILAMGLEAVMKKHVLFAVIFCGSLVARSAAQSAPMNNEMKTDHDHGMSMAHDHGEAVPVSFDDLTKTAAMLEKARRATERYKDVRVAQSDGYQATGPDVPGMGIHFVSHKGRQGFDVEQPSILLYEKNPDVA